MRFSAVFPRNILMTVIYMTVICAYSPAKAQDASFGCKVLLCAASSNPSWSGVPYCVPVMQELFHRLAHGGGWPTCPEGHASNIGYQPYEACPVGMTPVGGMIGGGHNGSYSAWTPNENGDQCADLSKPRNQCGGGDAGCQTSYPTAPRTRRSNPYFVDITTANGTQRVYFSLEGY